MPQGGIFDPVRFAHGNKRETRFSDGIKFKVYITLVIFIIVF